MKLIKIGKYFVFSSGNSLVNTVLKEIWEKTNSGSLGSLKKRNNKLKKIIWQMDQRNSIDCEHQNIGIAEKNCSSYSLYIKSKKSEPRKARTSKHYSSNGRRKKLKLARTLDFDDFTPKKDYLFPPDSLSIKKGTFRKDSLESSKISSLETAVNNNQRQLMPTKINKTFLIESQLPFEMKSTSVISPEIFDKDFNQSNGPMFKSSREFGKQSDLVKLNSTKCMENNSCKNLNSVLSPDDEIGDNKYGKTPFNETDPNNVFMADTVDPNVDLRNTNNNIGTNLKCMAAKGTDLKEEIHLTQLTKYQIDTNGLIDKDSMTLTQHLEEVCGLTGTNCNESEEGEHYNNKKNDRNRQIECSFSFEIAEGTAECSTLTDTCTVTENLDNANDVNNERSKTAQQLNTSAICSLENLSYKSKNMKKRYKKPKKLFSALKKETKSIYYLIDPDLFNSDRGTSTTKCDIRRMKGTERRNKTKHSLINTGAIDNTLNTSNNFAVSFNKPIQKKEEETGKEINLLCDLEVNINNGLKNCSSKEYVEKESNFKTISVNTKMSDFNRLKRTKESLEGKKAMIDDSYSIQNADTYPIKGYCSSQRPIECMKKERATSQAKSIATTPSSNEMCDNELHTSQLERNKMTQQFKILPISNKQHNSVEELSVGGVNGISHNSSPKQKNLSSTLKNTEHQKGQNLAGCKNADDSCVNKLVCNNDFNIKDHPPRKQDLGPTRKDTSIVYGYPDKLVLTKVCSSEENTLINPMVPITESANPTNMTVSCFTQRRTIENCELNCPRSNELSSFAWNESSNKEAICSRVKCSNTTKLILDTTSTLEVLSPRVSSLTDLSLSNTHLCADNRGNCSNGNSLSWTKIITDMTTTKTKADKSQISRANLSPSIAILDADDTGNCSNSNSLCTTKIIDVMTSTREVKSPDSKANLSLSIPIMYLDTTGNSSIPSKITNEVTSIKAMTRPMSTHWTVKRTPPVQTMCVDNTGNCSIVDGSRSNKSIDGATVIKTVKSPLLSDLTSYISLPDESLLMDGIRKCPKIDSSYTTKKVDEISNNTTLKSSKSSDMSVLSPSSFTSLLDNTGKCLNTTKLVFGTTTIMEVNSPPMLSDSTSDISSPTSFKVNKTNLRSSHHEDSNSVEAGKSLLNVGGNKTSVVNETLGMSSMNSNDSSHADNTEYSQNKSRKGKPTIVINSKHRKTNIIKPSQSCPKNYINKGSLASKFIEKPLINGTIKNKNKRNLQLKKKEIQELPLSPPHKNAVSQTLVKELLNQIKHIVSVGNDACKVSYNI